MTRRIATYFLVVLFASPVWAEESSAPAEEPSEPAAPAEAAGAERVTILFTSDLRGALIDSGCAEGSEKAALLPQVAAAVNAERDRAAREGTAAPVLLDAGDAHFPSPMVRDMAVGRPDVLVSALQSAGYDAMATGNTTLSAPRPAMEGLLRAASDADLPVLATNLRCVEPETDEESEEEESDEEDQEGETDSPDACAGSVAGLTQRQTIIERGELRIGVFSVLAEDLADRISRQNMEGAEFWSPMDATAQAVRELREQGADVVVLLSHVDQSETAPHQTLTLVSRLPEGAAPDLVVAASTAGLAIRIRTSGEGPAVLATSGRRSVGRAVLQREGDRWIVSDAGEVSTTGSSDELTGRIVSSWRAGYCELQSRQVPGGELSGEMDDEDFLHLALRVMREQTRSEIAIINTGAIADDSLFPLEGPLTKGHVRRALPFDNELHVAVVRGSKISKIARHLLNRDGSIQAGLERRGTKYRVNGRAVDPDARYRVVTIDYVADGGDGILDPSAFNFEAADAGDEGEVMLAERIGSWLGVRPSEGAFDPDDRLDLYSRPLWAGIFQIDVGLSDVHISNNASYDQPQLERLEQFDFRMGADFRGGVSNRNHRWDNQLTLRYGRQRLQDSDDAERYEWTESEDLISFRSAYVLDYVRNAVLDGAWYGPSFYLEYQLESEFQPPERDPEDTEDPPHFLEMTGTAGLQLRPQAWLKFQVGGGVRSTLSDDDSAPLPGLSVRGELTRRRFFGMPDAPVYIAALVDYFLSWPDQGATSKLTVEGRVEVMIFGPLHFEASLRFFLYDEPGAPLATAVDTSLGLGVTLGSRTQRY